MPKISQVRGLVLVACLGAPLVAASCARETSSFEPGGGQAGGAKASAGNKPAGGHSAIAGTTGSAFGGTSAPQGGKSTAGGVGADTSDDEGGDASPAGSAGNAAGGSAMVPPDVLMRASAVVYYQTAVTAASVSRIEMKLNLKNQSPDPLPMTNVSIRYWLTAEATPTVHNYYAGPSVTPVKTVFVDAGAESYALMTFVGAGTILQQEGDLNKSEIQLVLDSPTGSFTQTDDFSWDPSAATSQPNPKITMYLGDELIWGCEPSGRCVGDGGGDGGAGAGGQSPVGDAGAAGQGSGGQSSSGQAGEATVDAGGQGGAAP
jgi:hypothetical protein